MIKLINMFHSNSYNVNQLLNKISEYHSTFNVICKIKKYKIYNKNKPAKGHEILKYLKI